MTAVCSLPHLTAPAVLQSYDRRKLAALEVEQLVRNWASKDDIDRVYSLVDTLSQSYATPGAQSNARKGALLCLAAVSVGLAGSSMGAVAQTEDFLARVLPNILTACTDADARVRYYSLEALYNVSKSTRPGILLFFPRVFDILFRLCSDPDIDVQNATSFLSDLIKDCVAQSADFDLAGFLPHLVSCLEVESSPKRLFLLGWITLLNSLPHTERKVHRALPQVLPGVLSFLEDPAPEVRHSADKLLEELATDIGADASRADLGQVGTVLAAQVLHASLAGDGQNGGASQIEALRMLGQIVDAAPPEQLAPHAPVLLRAGLISMDTTDQGIQALAMQLNGKLAAKASTALGGENPAALLDAATEGMMVALQETAKLEALRWTALLLQQHASAALKLRPAVLSALCAALASTSDRVVQEASGVLVSNTLCCIDWTCAFHCVR